jgi:hypothetical protein
MRLPPQGDLILFFDLFYGGVFLEELIGFLFEPLTHLSLLKFALADGRNLGLDGHFRLLFSLLRFSSKISGPNAVALNT